MQALYSPGSSCAVRYRVRAHDPGGRPRLLSVTAEARSTPRKPIKPSVLFQERYRLRDPVEQTEPYLIWVFPYDPALKGLEEAAWGPSVAEAMGSWRPRPRAVRVQPLRYRPMRGALFRYQKFYGSSAPSQIAYGKALRTLRARASSEIADALTRRRGLFARRAPAMPHLALPADRMAQNILLFHSMPGRSLRDLLLADASLPDPDRVVNLLKSLEQLTDRIGHIRSTRHSRSWDTTLASTVTLLTQLVPDVASEVRRIAEVIERKAVEDSVPPGIVHGDFYDAQILVRDDFTLGLVDVDDLGLGDPALDAANFTTHLLALAMARPAAKERLLAYRTLIRRRFVELLRIAPQDLLWREALVMLQLAAGPFRVLEHNWPVRLSQHVSTAARLIEQEPA